MKCPHCSRPVDHEAHTCYSCGYSLATAESIFGRNYVQMSRLHDAAHCLRKPERDVLEDILDQLEMRFPQLLFCVYLGALTKEVKLNELGFWLLNHAEVRGADYARSNENGVLLLIDVNTKQAGISLGYLGELLLPEAEGYRCLQAARPYLVNGAYGQALAILLRKIGRVLSRRARQIKRNPREIEDASKSRPIVPEVIPPDPEPLPREMQAAMAGRL
ncbi:MAG: TPM domain-containing protein [Verrucomicrobiales bacterium]|nr:TPM domain-containing protein [Verrucomicrobiales bacterium]